MKKLIIIAITSILISLTSQAKDGRDSSWSNDAQIAVVKQYKLEAKVLKTQHEREVNAVKDALRAEGLSDEALVVTPKINALIAAYNEKVKKLKAEVARQILALRSIDLTKENEKRIQK